MVRPQVRGICRMDLSIHECISWGIAATFEPESIRSQ
jgi:hypothetical protein